jgi:hypothetical protein
VLAFSPASEAIRPCLPIVSKGKDVERSSLAFVTFHRNACYSCSSGGGVTSGLPSLLAPTRGHRRVLAPVDGLTVDAVIHPPRVPSNGHRSHFEGFIQPRRCVDACSVGSHAPSTHVGKRAATEPFIVMSSRWTRLLGVVGVVASPIVLYPLVWGWANELPLWWMLLMAPVPVLAVAVAIQYLVLGRYPILVLDRDGVTYRPYEDPVTLLRRGPVVRLRWDEISSIGTMRGGRLKLRWLTIRSNRTRQRPRWMRALGAGERAPYIRISLSVVPVSEHKLVDELRSRAQPHTFTDERRA